MERRRPQIAPDPLPLPGDRLAGDDRAPLTQPVRMLLHELGEPLVLHAVPEPVEGVARSSAPVPLPQDVDHVLEVLVAPRVGIFLPAVVEHRPPQAR